MDTLREQNTDSLIHPFDSLTPSFILNAVDHHGYMSDGRILALNSYENRVYQVGIEDDEPIIAKFYRPERWTNKQILEEHQFCDELVTQNLPVVPPLEKNGETLFQYGRFSASHIPKKRGACTRIRQFG